MTTEHEDIAQRAAALLEHLFRIGTFPDLESLVAAMVLYLRVRKAAPTTSGTNDAECEAMFRKAHDRYLAQRAEKLYGPPLGGVQ